MLTRHSVPIAVGCMAGNGALDRLSDVPPCAAFGVTVPLAAASAIGAFVLEQQRVTTCVRVHQRAIAPASRLGSFGVVAAALARVIHQPLAAIGEAVRVTTTGPQGKGLGRSRGRSIIAADGGRLTIGGAINGAAASLMLALARSNSEARE